MRLASFLRGPSLSRLGLPALILKQAFEGETPFQRDRKALVPWVVRQTLCHAEIIESKQRSDTAWQREGGLCVGQKPIPSDALRLLS